MLYALNSDPDGSSQVLWEDGERIFCRGWRIGDDGNRSAVLVVLPAAEPPSRSSFDRLTHEYALKDQLDGTWAVQPLNLTNDGARWVSRNPSRANWSRRGVAAPRSSPPP